MISADFDGADEQSAVDVKLDLAKTYLEMGDPEGAKEILEELIEDSDESSDTEGVAKARGVARDGLVASANSHRGATHNIIWPMSESRLGIHPEL